MKILLLSNLYPPNDVGGYERLCFEVASALATRGHAVTVLTSTHGGKIADYPGQAVLRRLRLLTGETIYDAFPSSAKERQAINRKNIAITREVIAKIQPDVLFVCNLYFLDKSLLGALNDAPRAVLMLTDNWLIAMLRPEFIRRYFQDVVHGDAPEPGIAPADGLLRGLLRRLRSAHIPFPLPNVTDGLSFEVVYGADFVRKLHAAAGITFPREVVIHNGVRQAPRAVAEFPDRFRLVDEGELRLLFAGRIVDIKGAHTAVEAMPILQDLPGSPRVLLTLLGDMQQTDYLRRLQDLIAAGGCGHLIRLREPVQEEELFGVFAEHDIYLFPSLYEPFSLTLIHALAAGIPTVASCVGGNVEIVRDRETGLLFRKGDVHDLARAVRELAIDAALRARIAKAGQRQAASFTFETMVRRIEAFLNAGSTGREER